MEVIGIEIGEFIAIIISIVTVMWTARKTKSEGADDVAEAVHHLIGPINEKVRELEAELVRVEEEAIDYKKKVTVTLESVNKDLDKYSGNMVQSIDSLREKFSRLID